MILARSLRERWSGLAPREQRFVTAGALVVAFAIAYAFVWQPVVADLPRADREAARAGLRLERARFAALASQTRGAIPTRAPIDAAIRAGLARTGIAAAEATLEADERRATLVLASVRFETLVALLDVLARDAGLHAVDATITARVEPGSVRAELVLAR